MERIGIRKALYDMFYAGNDKRDTRCLKVTKDSISILRYPDVKTVGEMQKDFSGHTLVVLDDELVSEHEPIYDGDYHVMDWHCEFMALLLTKNQQTVDAIKHGRDIELTDNDEDIIFIAFSSDYTVSEFMGSFWVCTEGRQKLNTSDESVKILMAGCKDENDEKNMRIDITLDKNIEKLASKLEKMYES